MSDDMVQLTLTQVRDLAQKSLVNSGCDQINAAAVAAVITEAERHGAHSHGLFRMPGYMAGLKSGKVNGRAAPMAEKKTASHLHVDGDRGYAPLAHQVMLDPLEAMAKEQGVAIAAINRTHHFASLWYEAELLARRGLVVMTCVSFKPALPPAGGKTPLFGTNPMAFAWPRAGHEPMVFDQASAVMARGEVMIAAREGHTLPDGVGIDAEGQPTNDPDAVLKGAMLPYGGYKGGAIALMIELLAGPLIGEVTSQAAAEADNNDGGPPTGGQFVLAMSPERLGHDPAMAEQLFESMLAQEGVRLPGDGRRQRIAGIELDGVSIPESLYKKILAA